jgi:hypothetical protein
MFKQSNKKNHISDYSKVSVIKDRNRSPNRIFIMLIFLFDLHAVKKESGRLTIRIDAYRRG